MSPQRTKAISNYFNICCNIYHVDYKLNLFEFNQNLSLMKRKKVDQIIFFFFFLNIYTNYKGIPINLILFQSIERSFNFEASVIHEMPLKHVIYSSAFWKKVKSSFRHYPFNSFSSYYLILLKKSSFFYLPHTQKKFHGKSKNWKIC